MPVAKIHTKQALYTLAKLYSELAGSLRRAKDKPAVRANIEHVAATILLLDPDYDLRSIRPVARYKRNPLFKRGRGFNLALDALRRAGRPLSCPEIARIMLDGRGISRPSAKLVEHMASVVRRSFNNHAGELVEEDRSTRPSRWEIVA